MPDWDQIVVGGGSSAMMFLHAAYRGSQSRKFVHNRTLVVGRGGAHLWKKVEGFNPSYKMGQPQHLLRPSGQKHNVRDSGGLRPLPGRTTDYRFTETGDYNRMLDQLRETVDRDHTGRTLEYADENVIKIQPLNPGYMVICESNVHTATQVIVACGPGPAQYLDGLPGVAVEGDLTPLRESGEYVEAVQYMTTKQPKDMRVLVYGGSATASWSVAQAFAMEAKGVLWACRQGKKQIDTEGNPIGRNSETIRRADERKMIHAAEVAKIKVHGDRTAFEGRLEVTFKKIEPPITTETVVFDQIVSAIGVSPLEGYGPGAMLDVGIRDRMQIVWDHNYRFSTDEKNKVVTALKDSGGDLWVVGAAVFRGLGFVHGIGSGPANRYAKAGEIFCGGGRPPEGIAILDATINAVTGFNQTDSATFNWSKANRRDIFQFLAKTYSMDIPNSVREYISAQIVEARSKTEIGLSKREFSLLMEKIKAEKGLRINLELLPGYEKT